jgi:hypothetical protein
MPLHVSPQFILVLQLQLLLVLHRSKIMIETMHTSCRLENSVFLLFVCIGLRINQIPLQLLLAVIV